MSQIQIQDFNITFSDNIPEKSIEEAISRGFAGVASDAKTAYLVKLRVGEMRADQVYRATKWIQSLFEKQGLNNCIFIPLCDNGIQDIEIIEVSNERT